jgi:hypothetical protein
MASNLPALHTNTPATLQTVLAPAPAWAAASGRNLDHPVPFAWHDSAEHQLTAPDGTTAMTCRFSTILEVGEAASIELDIAGPAFAAVDLGDVPVFATALRSFADALDAEAIRIGGLR